ncbi:MAG: hypothetical protein KA712_24675 [Myxococcales bacterium]|nr:hypothetical protein [Myxococcales bacterium]
MSDSSDAALALAALDRAILLRKPRPGLIHHSDRGSPYGSDEYIRRLDSRIADHVVLAQPFSMDNGMLTRNLKLDRRAVRRVIVPDADSARP